MLLTTNSTHSAAPALFKKVPYDPIQDFTPIARIGSFPSVVVVNPTLKVNSIQELVAYAKANPGKLSYGHGNSTGHIAGEAIKYQAGLDIVRVSYRSNPVAITDLIAGHILDDDSGSQQRVAADRGEKHAAARGADQDAQPELA